MWADNEVNVDLLNVEHLTAALLQLIENDRVVPATIGVYGDWGSGKSTVLRLVEAALRTEEKAKAGVLCVWFNSWQFESYDDAKAALMSAILDALEENRGTLAKLTEPIARFARRIRWMRVLRLGAKTGVRATAAVVSHGASEVVMMAKDAMVSGTGAQALEDVEGLLDDAKPEAGIETVKAFRDEFAKLLEAADVSRLVVIIDDLDRCLPQRVVETLEAIKLFLQVPRSVFIIGADEELVRHSVQAHFNAVSDAKPQLGRDYLEKLIQIPVYVTPMSPQEAEGYMNLLFAQLRLSPEDFESLRTKRAAAGVTKLGLVTFTPEDAERHLAAVPKDLRADFTMVRGIGPLLATHTGGNPRQTKRFLNALLLRLTMAQARGVAVRADVMAKLMLLEYARREAFVSLGSWDRAEDGRARELKTLEKAAEAKNSDDADVTDKAFLTDAWLRTWLRSEPMLGDVDLGPYLYFARTRHLASALANRLSPAAERVFLLLRSALESERITGEREAKALPSVDATAVFTALVDHTDQHWEDDQSKDGSSLMALFALASQQSDIVGELFRYLNRADLSKMPPRACTQVLSLTQGTPASSSAEQLLAKWASDAPPGLKQAANNAKKRLAARPPAGARRVTEQRT